MTEGTGVLVPPGDAARSPRRSSRCSRTSRGARRSGESARRLADRALLVGHDRRAARADLRGRGRLKVLRSDPSRRRGRGVASCSPFSAGSAHCSGSHGPDWAAFKEAFTVVEWEWVAVAIGFNLLSVVASRVRVADRDQRGDAAAAPGASGSSSPRSRSVCSRTRCSRPGRRARAGRRPQPEDREEAPGLWSTLVGTVFVHRVFDLVPVLFITIWVLFAAKIPGWRARASGFCSRPASRCSCSHLRPPGTTARPGLTEWARCGGS